MRKTALIAPVFALAALAATIAHADERPEHFEGKSAENLEQALTNLAEANAELEERLDGDLSDEDMARIHELSYTMENALQRIQQDTESLAVTLEEIHLASERMDRSTVENQGPKYLEKARPLAD